MADPARSEPAELLASVLPGALRAVSVHGEASVGRLVRELEAHAAVAAEEVAGYRQLAEASPDPVCTALTRLLQTEESKHRRLLEELVRSLRQAAAATQPPSDGGESNGHGEAGAAAAALIARHLLREEREAARHLRHLARQSPDVADGVYRLLLETMARESDAHEQVLRYIVRRLDRATAAYEEWPAVSIVSSSTAPKKGARTLRP